MAASHSVTTISNIVNIVMAEALMILYNIFHVVHAMMCFSFAKESREMHYLSHLHLSGFFPSHGLNSVFVLCNSRIFFISLTVLCQVHYLWLYENELIVTQFIVLLNYAEGYSYDYHN